MKKLLDFSLCNKRDNYYFLYIIPLEWSKSRNHLPHSVKKSFAYALHIHQNINKYGNALMLQRIYTLERDGLKDIPLQLQSMLQSHLSALYGATEEKQAWVVFTWCCYNNRALGMRPWTWLSSYWETMAAMCPKGGYHLQGEMKRVWCKLKEMWVLYLQEGKRIVFWTHGGSIAQTAEVVFDVYVDGHNSDENLVILRYPMLASSQWMKRLCMVDPILTHWTVPDYILQIHILTYK